MQQNMHALSILFQKMVNMFIPSQIYSPNNRWKISYKQLNNSLNFSDEKLEELKKKNQMVKLQKDERKGIQVSKRFLLLLLVPILIYWVSSSECRAV